MTFDVKTYNVIAQEGIDVFPKESYTVNQTEKPDALLIGEVWETANHWLQGDMFDSAMNYDFRKHCNLFFAERNMDAFDFAGRVTNMLMRYKLQITPAQLNLLDSHDVSRFLSLCGGDVQSYKLALVFMMTFIGMPTIFYGDELGIQGVLEEEYRHPMPWNGGDRDLHEFVKKVIAMRHKLAPLRRGTFRMLRAEQNSRLLVYERELDGHTVTIYINNDDMAFDLPKEDQELYLAEGLSDGVLNSRGFAIFSSGKV